MRIDYSKSFIKQYKKLPLSLQLNFEERIDIFLQDKFHPVLRNHKLSGRWFGCRSINITGDWRAIFREFTNENLIYFDAIGTHGQLYR